MLFKHDLRLLTSSCLVATIGENEDHLVVAKSEVTYSSYGNGKALIPRGVGRLARISVTDTCLGFCFLTVAVQPLTSAVVTINTRHQFCFLLAVGCIWRRTISRICGDKVSVAKSVRGHPGPARVH